MARDALTRALAIAALASFATGCGRLIAAIGEEAEERVREEIIDQRRAAPGDDPEIPGQLDPIVVDSVLPARGEIGGGLLVAIFGEGFAPGMQVYFGDTPAVPADTEIVSGEEIHVVTPPNTVGWVDVTIVDTVTHRGVLEDGFEYFEPVSLTQVNPGDGPATGGTYVILRGTGLIRGTVVLFSTTALQGGSATASSITLHEAVVSTPRLPRGVYDVTVSNDNGDAVLEAAFAVWDPTRVDGVTPFAGPIAGGTPIVVRGVGLSEDSVLSLGGQVLAAVANADETELTAVTAPASPAIEGPVAVTVEGARGSDTLPGGFVFYGAGAPGLRLLAVSPTDGLINGGTRVELVGAGFAEAGVEVLFGGNPASCESRGEQMLVCATPPGPPGTVDVRVVAEGVESALPGGFEYWELRLDTMLPNRGATAGGTWVTVHGSGFLRGVDLAFAGVQARDIELEGPTRLTLRTPPGPAGTVSVSAALDGVEAARPEAFSYFDPLHPTLWSSGGPIEDSVNITVIDGSRRLEGAFVMLGTDPATPYQGFTNPGGQITFSGPDVQGPLTVTAGKPEYSLFAWADVDARDLTLWLVSSRSAGGSSSGAGAAPAVVRGKVRRIKDDYNYGDDDVEVTTTEGSSPQPDAGPGAILVNQGDYELWARGGDMVVLALAGRLRASGKHVEDVHAVGFHPFMFTELGSGDPCLGNEDCPSDERCWDFGDTPLCTHVYEDVDIVIDTPMQQQLHVELDDPPLWSPELPISAPDTAEALVWYDFGYMGLWWLDRVTAPDSAVVLVDMPRRLPEALAGTPFTVYAGVYTYRPVDTTYWPQSEVFLPGLLDTAEPVFATPVLGTQHPVTPYSYEAVGEPMRFEFQVNKPVLPSANVHYFYFADAQRVTLSGVVFTPGPTRGFDLPVFPDIAAGARMPSNSPGDALSQYYWQLMAVYTPGALFNQLNPDAVFDWHSRAANLSVFVIP